MILIGVSSQWIGFMIWGMPMLCLVSERVREAVGTTTGIRVRTQTHKYKHSHTQLQTMIVKAREPGFHVVDIGIWCSGCLVLAHQLFAHCGFSTCVRTTHQKQKG